MNKGNNRKWGVQNDCLSLRTCGNGKDSIDVIGNVWERHQRWYDWGCILETLTLLIPLTDTRTQEEKEWILGTRCWLLFGTEFFIFKINAVHFQIFKICYLSRKHREYKYFIFLKADIIWVSVECWSSYPIFLSEIWSVSDEFHCVWNVLNFSNIQVLFFFKHVQFLSTNFSISWNSIMYLLKMLPNISGLFFGFGPSILLLLSSFISLHILSKYTGIIESWPVVRKWYEK